MAAKFSNAVGARVRSLPFRHAVHAGLACTRCHGAAVDAPVAAACASCHEQHHTRNANCAGCHQPPPPTAHAAGAHEGCSGAGCHDDAAVIALPLSRPVCLACHRAQAAHEPDAECGTCHVVALQAPRNTQVAAP